MAPLSQFVPPAIRSGNMQARSLMVRVVGRKSTSPLTVSGGVHDCEVPRLPWLRFLTALRGHRALWFNFGLSVGGSTGLSLETDSLPIPLIVAIFLMAIVPHTVQVPGGKPLTLYGETANLNYFLVSDLDPDEIGGPSVVQVSASGGSRRAYPGAAPRSFAGSQREVLRDPGRRLGIALPGKPFILVETDSGSAKEKRQFTFRGRYIDLHSFLSASVSRNVRLLGPTGASTKIANSAPGP